MYRQCHKCAEYVYTQEIQRHVETCPVTWEVSTSREAHDAYDAWMSHHAYIDDNGNYHVRKGWSRRGPIAPWNKTIKRLYATVGIFNLAAKAWQAAQLEA